MRLIPGKVFYNKPWYSSYKAMMDRCYRKNASNYPNYGGRGIKVCEEWHNIEVFERWCYKSGYEKGLTLERINVNGNYEPSNCCWATKKEQANNRRNTVFIEHNGECHTISEWANITGINRSTLNNRYTRGARGENLFKKVRSYKGISWELVNGRRGVERVRLIDCDALIEDLKKWKGLDDKTVEAVFETAKKQPTAYDPEKVVAELEEYKYSHLVEHDSERYEHCKEEEINCDGRDCFLCVWDKAIEIVRKGGV